MELEIEFELQLERGNWAERVAGMLLVQNSIGRLVNFARTSRWNWADVLGCEVGSRAEAAGPCMSRAQQTDGAPRQWRPG
jgi:hypothetical protein